MEANGQNMFINLSSCENPEHPLTTELTVTFNDAVARLRMTGYLTII